MIGFFKNIGVLMLLASYLISINVIIELQIIETIAVLGLAFIFIGVLVKVKNMLFNRVDINDPGIYLYNRSFIGVDKYIVTAGSIFLAYNIEMFFLKYVVIALIVINLIEPVFQQITIIDNIMIVDDKIFIFESYSLMVDLNEVDLIEYRTGSNDYFVKIQKGDKIMISLKRISSSHRKRFQSDFNKLIEKKGITIKEID